MNLNKIMKNNLKKELKENSSSSFKMKNESELTITEQELIFGKMTERLNDVLFIDEADLNNIEKNAVSGLNKALSDPKMTPADKASQKIKFNGIIADIQKRKRNNQILAQVNGAGMKDPLDGSKNLTEMGIGGISAPDVSNQARPIVLTKPISQQAPTIEKQYTPKNDEYSIDFIYEGASGNKLREYLNQNNENIPENIFPILNRIRSFVKKAKNGYLKYADYIKLKVERSKFEEVYKNTNQTK